MFRVLAVLCRSEICSLKDVVTECINTTLKRKTTTKKQPVIAAANGALFITQKELVLNTFTQTLDTEGSYVPHITPGYFTQNCEIFHSLSVWFTHSTDVQNNCVVTVLQKNADMFLYKIADTIPLILKKKDLNQLLGLGEVRGSQRQN